MNSVEKVTHLSNEHSLLCRRRDHFSRIIAVFDLERSKLNRFNEDDHI